MTFASLCFFAATFIASARLTFAVSKDFISFSVGGTSGSGVRCANADVAAHKMRSERILVFRTQSVLPSLDQMALKAGPNVGAHRLRFIRTAPEVGLGLGRRFEPLILDQ